MSLRNNYLEDSWHENIIAMLQKSGVLFAKNSTTQFYVLDGKAYGIRNATAFELGEYFTFLAYIRERNPVTFQFI